MDYLNQINIRSDNTIFNIAENKHNILNLMKIAFIQAQLGLKNNEVPIGAVLYNPKTKKIVAQGHNQCEAHQNKLMHAEFIALMEYHQNHNSKYLDKFWAFVTLEPCASCIAQLLNSGMTRLYYSLDDYKYGFFNGNYINLKSSSKNLQIYAGLMENISKTLLRTFFANLRNKNLDVKMIN